MMTFYKYHGAGNDFIIFNMMEDIIELTENQIRFLCHRNFGIGADGVMLLLPSSKADFRMKYYNSDGLEGTMCGNGGRCIIAFAQDMGIIKENYHFMAIDGVHYGKILTQNNDEKIVELQMSDVTNITEIDGKLIIDTGSLHYLDFQKKIDDIDVFQEGKRIRYSDIFGEEGINVNFIEEKENQLYVRTYERGVENETLACGTGVTAAAIASGIRQNLKYKSFLIKTLGGELQVRFNTEDGKSFSKVYLTGPTQFVFKGTIDIHKMNI